MSRKEDIEKLNSLVAEVNALAEKIRNDYAEGQEDDVLAQYEKALYENAYWVNAAGQIDHGTGLLFDNNVTPYEVFLNYPSEEFAEQAKKMKKFNDMLLAFKWCYDKTYEPEWDDSDSLKYHVHYNVSLSMYTVDHSYGLIENGVYFSTRIRAEDCANWLNKVDPEGELVK